MKMLFTGWVGFIGFALIRFFLINGSHAVVGLYKLLRAGDLNGLEIVFWHENSLLEDHAVVHRIGFSGLQHIACERILQNEKNQIDVGFNKAKIEFLCRYVATLNIKICKFLHVYLEQLAWSLNDRRYRREWRYVSSLKDVVI